MDTHAEFMYGSVVHTTIRAKTVLSIQIDNKLGCNKHISTVAARGQSKLAFLKVLEKCTKNLIGHSRLAFNNHESNIDC